MVRRSMSKSCLHITGSGRKKRSDKAVFGQDRCDWVDWRARVGYPGVHPRIPGAWRWRPQGNSIEGEICWSSVLIL